MRLNEIDYTDAKPIDGYGPGFFRVGGDVHEGAVLVSPEGVAPWGGMEDSASLLSLAGKVDVVFIGTGSTITHIPAPLREALEQAGIGAEPMASPSACRTYNILLSEGRRIAAALIPVAASS
ncbi:Mth938-like domain-containing protein [Alphaproteobacteria bacterium KMM 3653]|uniref:Mth938-like domain-containing protein n=1 Tax=Harenicola maris TaxID=2841044 RepID=A0AAP2CMK2_9RHOB|nr:Mth938-like domain-containing protein [Harenicola maris]